MTGYRSPAPARRPTHSRRQSSAPRPPSAERTGARASPTARSRRAPRRTRRAGTGTRRGSECAASCDRLVVLRLASRRRVFTQEFGEERFTERRRPGVADLFDLVLDGPDKPVAVLEAVRPRQFARLQHPKPDIERAAVEDRNHETERGLRRP